MILCIDNYDSFIHNLARYFEVLGHHCLIHRNDAIDIATIRRLNPSHIVISPGPCTPKEAGISLDVIHAFSGHIPILGICLGHQAIGHAFGACVTRAEYPMHGNGSDITHGGDRIFQNILNPLYVGRYHSLIIAKTHFPSCLDILAESPQGEIMAIQHRYHATIGLQFHPESILTQQGSHLLRNFLMMTQNVKALTAP
ncbi:MAG: anthranilate/aminodeoxychorismate synthase component II [Coxiella sp. RIFCSPHIGHO2_12_FULL_44_14]|nr:MAG: anthranilate/aminodeoxychorismate synthase component II [Coxiella sp. RIFCSPHIGHO2_12_FULL_44_14]